MKTYLVLSDIHVPFHCPKYLNIALKIIKEYKLAGLAQLGDALDLFQVSSYDKDPARKNTVADDIAEWSHTLTRLCKNLPRGAEVHLIEGNHSTRLQRYIARHAKELHGIVPDLPKLLNLKAREQATGIKFKWHPYNKWNSCKIGDCVLMHGYYFNSHTAMTNLAKYRVNTISAHTHRFQWVSDGEHYAISLGHGSNELETAHQPTPTGWTQAMAVLTVNDDGKTSVEPIIVNNGKAVFRGKIIQG